MSDLNEGAWLPAASAFEKLVASVTFPNFAADALATSLREGKIRVRALAYGVTREPLLSKAWKKVRLQDSYIMVPQRFWQGNRFFHEDREVWRWKMSRFHSTLSKEPAKRRIVRRAEFNVEDLERLFPLAFGLAEPKKKRTRPPDIASRDAIWCAVLDVISSTPLGDELWSNRPVFTDEVNARLETSSGKRRAGLSAVNEVIRQAYPRMETLRKHLDAI